MGGELSSIEWPTTEVRRQAHHCVQSSEQDFGRSPFRRGVTSWSVYRLLGVFKPLWQDHAHSCSGQTSTKQPKRTE